MSTAASRTALTSILRRTSTTPLLLARLASSQPTTMTQPSPHFIDIGVNLTDPIFRGNHHGKQAHQDDFNHVLDRAKKAGVVAQIITGGNLAESRQALELAATDDSFYSTAGCHPTRTSEMEAHNQGPQAYLEEISELVRSSRTASDGSSPTRSKVVAIGECGLDYDRLHFSPADVQKRHFASQLDLAIRCRLPLFLHSRAAHADFVEILAPRIEEIHQANQAAATSSKAADNGAKRVGVVHSFTGTAEEMHQLVNLGLFIGVNGCSLKTQENLDVVKAIPLDRIMLETDAPWCDPRSTHGSAPHIQAFKSARPSLHALYQPALVKKEKWRVDSMVKGRNEPCVIGAVAATVAAVKGIEIEEVASAAMDNTRWLFGL